MTASLINFAQIMLNFPKREKKLHIDDFLCLNQMLSVEKYVLELVEFMEIEAIATL